MAVQPATQRQDRRRPQPLLREFRCPYCDRLLIRAELKPGSKVEAYCGHCHRHHLFGANSSAVW